MRSLPRLAVLGTLAAALVITPSAMAATSLSATVSPNKGGSINLATPTTFGVKATFPDTASDPSGNVRLQSIVAKLPLPLLFNTIPFGTCDAASFTNSKVCSSATKLGTAKIVADGGPDIASPIDATADIYVGTGFSLLTRVQASAPALIDEAVTNARLESSGTAGYGLQMYIPVPQTLQQPIPGVYPTIKSLDATFTPPVKKVTVPGIKGKQKLPLAGLGPCPSSKKLNFRIDINYTDSTGPHTDGNGQLVPVKTDTAIGAAKCKK
jgi:hypothetical protein